MSPVVSRGLAQISLEDPEHMRTLAEQAAEEANLSFRRCLEQRSRHRLLMRTLLLNPQGG